METAAGKAANLPTVTEQLGVPDTSVYMAAWIPYRGEPGYFIYRLTAVRGLESVAVNDSCTACVFGTCTQAIDEVSTFPVNAGSADASASSTPKNSFM